MRTVLPPIAALTAVCISIPAAGVSVANAASTDDAKGPASHSVAAPQIALAAATSDLKLVLANVGSDPGLGAAAANAGQKFEILALPKNLANNVVATNGTTSGLSSTVVDAGRQAAANLLAEANQVSLAADTPTNNVVQRALQGAWDIALWINASGQTAALPVGFDPTTYVSFLKVVSNFVQVGVLPLTVANLLVQGQWSKIQPTVTSTTNTAFTSLTQGLPTSIAETLNWVLTGQTPAPTMALNATTVNSTSVFQGLPTSVFQGLPTSVFQGLPTPFAQALDGILTGQTPADMGVKATENSQLKAPATGKAVQQDLPDNVEGDGTAKPGGSLSGIVNGGGDNTNPDGTTKPGGVLSGITKGAGIATGGGIANGGGPVAKPGGVLSGITKGTTTTTKPGGVLSGITKGTTTTTTKPGGVLSGITKGTGITKSGASATTADSTTSTTSKSGDTGNEKDGVGKHRRGD